MASSIISLIATVLVPVLKWIFEKQANKKLSDKEFVEYILKHQEKRGRAGQTVLDARDSREKLKASVAKKKDPDSKEE